MNIVENAESGTYWKRIILDIVSQEEFDPWDIDVGALADSYMGKVKDIKLVDFEVPGTVVLVGSVLLKLKSDIVSGQTFIFEGNLEGGDPEGIDDVSADIDEITGQPLPATTIPKLYVRRIPKRKVTLNELIVFLKRVITQVEKKDFNIDRQRPKLEIHLSRKDMERIMKDVHSEIIELAGQRGGKACFRELVEDWDREGVVNYLLPVLHLANKSRVLLEQEAPFGDIYITPGGKGDK